MLRGINVGGRNPVAMAELRAAFEAEGFKAVTTYIQSGNVLFESDGPSESLVMTSRRRWSVISGFRSSSSCGPTASSATSSTRHRTGSVVTPTPLTRT